MEERSSGNPLQTHMNTIEHMLRMLHEDQVFQLPLNLLWWSIPWQHILQNLHLPSMWSILSMLLVISPISTNEDASTSSTFWELRVYQYCLCVLLRGFCYSCLSQGWHMWRQGCCTPSPSDPSCCGLTIATLILCGSFQACSSWACLSIVEGRGRSQQRIVCLPKSCH